MKKLLPLFLAVAIAALSMVSTVYAEETYSGECGDDLHWSYSKSMQKLVIIGDGDMWDFQSESEVPWNHLKDSIRYLTLNEGLTSIGDMAFSSCSVKELIIPSTVTRIGVKAFYGVKRLEKLTIPGNVEEICAFAFSNSVNLVDLTVEDGVKTIGDGCFSWGKGLHDVDIADSVTHIGEGAFNSCHRLYYVTLPKDITAIEDYTFCSTSCLTEINIPEGVVSIGDEAFNGSGIWTIEIPASVKTIGDRAFMNCEYVKTLTFQGDDMPMMGEDAFLSVKPQIIDLPENTASVTDDFDLSEMRFMTIPSKVKYIGENVFLGINNTNVNRYIFFDGTREEWKKVEVDESNTEIIEKYPMFLNDLTVEGIYTDAAMDSWYGKSVAVLTNLGLMKGVGDGLFLPDKELSRAELVVMLYRMDSDLYLTGKNYWYHYGATPFTDVPQEGRWFSTGVRWAYHSSIVRGTTVTTFDPDGILTREQIVMMLYRFAAKCRFDWQENIDPDKMQTFADSTSVSNWAREGMAWAVNKGVITGVEGADGTLLLEPRATATRAQVAVMLSRFLSITE